MNIQRVRFLRELSVTDKEGKSTSMMEFSYDNPRDREPRFFVVPDNEQGQARQVYLEWGGIRSTEERRGTTVRKP